MTTTTATSAAVIEALKEAAIAKLKANVVDVPDVEHPKKGNPKKNKEESVEWPCVLKNDGPTKMFSELFPKEWAAVRGKNPDFAVPFFGDYEFPEHLRAYFPAGSDYMADPQLAYDAALAFATGSVTHLVGWPGTGKSNGLPVLLAHKLGLPLLRLGLNKKGMGLDDLVGRESIKQGENGPYTDHRDGVLVRWIGHPCIILADEFSRANTEITNGLMSLMERGGCLIVENRDSPVIKRHEHCWIIASDNVKGLGDGMDRGMVGTDQVDGAVLDRFEVTLEVDYLTESQNLALIQSWFPGFPESEARKIVKFGMLIQQGYKKGEMPLSFSPRSLKEVCRYACLHKDVAPAVRKVVLNKYAEEADISAIREFFRTAFGRTL